MKIHLLGTGTSTGVPVIGCDCHICGSTDPKNKRFRSSIAVEVDGEFIVIDTGPEFRLQALRAGITKLKHVLYTHIHADHSQGFDDLRAYSFYDKEPLEVYLLPDCQQEFHQRFDYAISGNSGYSGAIPKVRMISIPNHEFKVGPILVEPFRLPHGHVTSCAFRSGKFLYATDFKSFSENQIHRLRGKISVMVASGIHFGQHHSHSVIPETVRLFERLGVERGILTHLSHQVDYRKDDDQLPPGVEFAYDGMVIDL